MNTQADSSVIFRRPKVLSLFTGAGGLDIGFAVEGFDIDVSNDVEESFLRSICLNVGTYYPENHRAVVGDIAQLEASEFGQPGQFDIIIGGPPCQPFSAAGRRAGGVTGVSDFRGSLFWHYARIIDYFKPRVFLFENVRGLLQANKGRDWAVISQTFHELGYEIAHRLLDAADYGVPQHRERIIVVGTRGTRFLFPRPTHGPDSKYGGPFISAGEALADINDPDEVVPPYGGKYGDLLAEVPPGENYLYFTEEMGYPEPKFAWRSRFSDFLYKADPALPTKTIVASQGKYGGPFHWKGRKFTIPEFKRLQTFPDDYLLHGDFNLAVKQIGNSVAPRFAQHLAQALKSQVFGSEYPDLELLPEDFVLSFDSRKARKAKRTRKKRQLAKTETPVKQPDQEWPTLAFETEWAYVSSSDRAAASDSNPWPNYGRFALSGTLESGTWDLTAALVGGEDSQGASIELHIAFDRVVGEAFDRIRARLSSSTAWHAPVLWDVVNDAIAGSTSYDSIVPLYGHFTEPYPKFEIKTTAIDDAEPGVAAFLHSISDFAFLAGPRDLGELAEMFCYDKSDVIQVVKRLRAARFDVRVHETNRTIERGFFRVCYPFTQPLEGPRFTVWRDVGTHTTADHTSIPSD